MTVAQTRFMPHKSKPPALEALAGLKLNQSGGKAVLELGNNCAPRFSHKALLPVKAELCPMQHPPHPSQANRERLLAVMRVCHRLRQPLPPRTRLAPLVGCTSRQLHRYVERLKAEGVVALERCGNNVLYVREIGR